MTIRFPDNPVNIKWENLELPNKRRFIYGVGSVCAMFLFLFLSFFAIFCINQSTAKYELDICYDTDDISFSNLYLYDVKNAINNPGGIYTEDNISKMKDCYCKTIPLNYLIKEKNDGSEIGEICGEFVSFMYKS